MSYLVTKEVEGHKQYLSSKNLETEPEFTCNIDDAVELHTKELANELAEEFEAEVEEI